MRSYFGFVSSFLTLSDTEINIVSTIIAAHTIVKGDHNLFRAILRGFLKVPII